MLLQRVKAVKNHLFDRIENFYSIKKWKDLQQYLKQGRIQIGIDPLVGKEGLIISPHPDDESLGCGGTVSLATQSKAVFDVAYLSSGEMGHKDAEKWNSTQKKEFADLREKEAGNASRLLGIRKLHFLRGADGHLHEDNELPSKLLDLLSKSNYEVVFCPWPYDAHSDHIAAFKITMKALEGLSKGVDVWLYEVWNPCLPNRFVNIDSVVDIKRQAVNCYKSQIDQIDYTDKFLSLASYRSLRCPPATRAEAFFFVDKSSSGTLFRFATR